MQVQPSREPSRRGRAAGVLLGLVAALSFAASPESGSAAVRPQIVTPPDDATVLVGHGRLVARVKLNGPRGAARAGESFQAFLDGHDVTRRFRRVAPDRWRGTIRPRPGFGLRDHVLTVRTGKRLESRVDSSRFVAMRRDDRAMRVVYRTGWRQRPGNLLRVRTKRRLWSSPRLPAVRLNGHRVDRRLRMHGDRRGFGGGLGPEAGLRYGRNRVQVQVLQRNGVYARDVRSFWVPRDRPLVGAGPDRRTGVGEPVVLNGSWRRPPAASHAGAQSSATAEPLDLSWKVVEAPPGSQAEPLTPAAAETVLTPDVPGSYVLQLTATPPGGGKPGLDQVTVTVPQSDDPMGMPIQTIAANGAIRIGEASYPSSSGAVRPGVKMLVLSATALEPRRGEWGPAEQTFTPQANGHWTSSASNLDLLESLAAVGSRETVILSGQGRPLAGGELSSAQSESLGKAIAAIGGTTAAYGQTAGGAANLVNGQWSVIGRPGLTEGHADQSYFLSAAPLPAAAAAEFPGFPTDAGSPGSLNGYMQKVVEASYEFVSPEYMEIDTKWTPSLREAPSNTHNTILLGGQHYESASIPAGAIAVQLLVLSGSAPTKVLAQGTYTVLDPGCGTDYSGVYFLDQALHQWVSSTPGATAPRDSNLVVLQDFGRQTGWCWPGGNDTDWLQDALPNVTADGTGWVGSHFPTEPGQLFAVWNGANVHGFGSVAGNLGELAGTAAHDIVANYRRPFYDDKHKKFVNRDFGGLTAVASTHLYQWSSAFLEGQGDDPLPSEGGSDELLDNGRVTGVLRRNEQSQWELQSSAAGAGWANGKGEYPLNQKALWDLTFRDPSPWPCSPEHPEPCKGSVAEIEAAQAYFADRLSPNSGATNVRDLYPTYFKSEFTVRRVEGPYPEQPTRFGRFSKAVFKTLQEGVPGGEWEGLIGELEDIKQVGSGIELWQSFFIGIGNNGAQVEIGNVGNAVTQAVNDAYNRLLKEKREAQMETSLASDALYSLSEILDVSLIASGNPEAVPLAAPALGALGGMVALGSDVSDSFGDGPSGGQANVANDTEAIADKVTNITSDVAARYDNVAAAMEHFGGVFVDDPGKLREAANNFDPGGPWALPSSGPVQAEIGRAMAASIQTATYEALLPFAYTEWVVSPRHTNRDPSGPGELPGALAYTCTDTHGAGNRNPWTNTSSWVLSSVAWSGGGPTAGTSFTPQNSGNFLIRGLKSNLDDMHPERVENGDEPGLGHSGQSAPQWLLEPLFASYGAFGTAAKPGPLGASKEQVFALGWNTRKFQCGVDP